jgi:hypothetical protein
MLPAESSVSRSAAIYDSKGRLVKIITLTNAVNYAFKIEIKDLKTGGYFIQTQSGKAYRFIKE